MFRNIETNRRWIAVAALCVCLTLLSSFFSPSMAGDWGSIMHREKHSTSKAPAVQQPQSVRPPYAEPLPKPHIPTSATPEAKLFWFDCGWWSNYVGGEVCSGSIWFADPSSPSAVLFDDGIVINTQGDVRTYSIPTGTVNTDYSVSNLKIGYVFYFKNGSIWAIDTTTLDTWQVSREAGIVPFPGSQAAPGLLCWVASNPNWTNPNDSAITYQLAGPDGYCQSGDDVTKMVSLSMTAADPPLIITGFSIDEILLDGKRIVHNYTTSPAEVDICQADNQTCEKIATFQSDAAVKDFDRSAVILQMDGKLVRYNLTNKTTKILYTPGQYEELRKIRLDKGGTVYFVGIGTKQLGYNTNYANSVKKVTPSGTVTQLYNFSTPLPLIWPNDEELYFEVTPTHAVLGYPNMNHTAQALRSIPKAGGKAVMLTNSAVDGGAVGSYFFFEDTEGATWRVSLDGTTHISKKDSQLVGAVRNGTGDWYYDMDATSSGGLLLNKDHSVGYFVLAQDFTQAGVIKNLGVLPTNLSNLGGMGVESALIAYAGRRDSRSSYGQDVIFMDPGATGKSLNRLTNSNGYKLITGMD
jgi:hypothetical protein